VPVREQIRSDGAVVVGVDDTSLAQTHCVNLLSSDIPDTRELHSNHAGASKVSSEDVHSGLLKVLYLFKDHPLSRSALFRATEPQILWAKTGDISSVRIAETNNEEAWTCVFSSPSSLQSALEKCTMEGSIMVYTPQDEEVSYSLSTSCHEELQRSIPREALVLPGAMLVAHIFPREEFLDRRYDQTGCSSLVLTVLSFHRTGKMIMPYVHLVLMNLKLDGTMDIPDHARESLVEMFLACCRTRSRQKVFIPVFSSMASCESLPDYLMLAIAEVQSITHRAEGRLQESSDLIERTVWNTQHADIRTHCQKGRLALSLAENALLCELYQEAESSLSGWEVESEPPTQLELQVLRMKNTVVGRVSRYKGDFQHAAECLGTCLQGVQTQAARYHIVYHLADVYCELGNPKAAEHVLERDISRLEQEGALASKLTRRLFLPLAEALILQNRWKDAESKLVVLRHIFDQIVCSDFSDQLGHVRSIIGLARIAHHDSNYCETIDRTTKALGLIRDYKTFEESTFYGGFLYRLRASAYQRMGRSREAEENLELSERYHPEPRHFMAGIGTYVLNSLKISESMNSRGTDAPAEHPPLTGSNVLALPYP
jgi:tetratricopeptide (TPR) repeat protein